MTDPHLLCRPCRRRADRAGTRVCRRCHRALPASEYAIDRMGRPRRVCGSCCDSAMQSPERRSARAEFEDASIRALHRASIMRPTREVVVRIGPLAVVVVARSAAGEVRVAVEDRHGRRALERVGYSTVAAAMAYARSVRVA